MKGKKHKRTGRQLIKQKQFNKTTYQTLPFSNKKRPEIKNSSKPSKQLIKLETRMNQCNPFPFFPNIDVDLNLISIESDLN